MITMKITLSKKYNVQAQWEEGNLSLFDELSLNFVRTNFLNYINTFIYLSIYWLMLYTIIQSF